MAISIEAARVAADFLASRCTPHSMIGGIDSATDATKQAEKLLACFFAE